MAIFDIEDIMDDVKALMVANLQAKFTEINTEKGDSLLIDFTSDAYKLYRLPTVEGLGFYPVEFFQYLESGFNIVQELQEQVALSVPITIDVIVCDKFDCNSDRVALRYQRAIREVFSLNIAREKYTEVKFTKAEVISGTSQEGKLYTIASVTFEITVCI